jgi:lipopolysaccharide transport system permease protein
MNVHGISLGERDLPPKPPADELVIEPSSGWIALRLDELWRYRELLYFLVWREIKIRYKQTVLGVAWALLQPLFTMLVFSLFFGRLAKMPSDGIPYPVFSLTALVPWTFFANGLTQSSNSIVANASLIAKVYFPRLAVPISAVLSGVVDFALALLLSIGFLYCYGVPLTMRALWLPLFCLLAFATALGVGLWLSALNVEYRDIRFILPFLLQFWMYSTPIAYPSSLLPDRWRPFYGINPMVGVVEGFRWSLAGAQTEPGGMLAVSSAVAVLLLVSGAFYFRRMERTFADRV